MSLSRHKRSTKPDVRSPPGKSVRAVARAPSGLLGPLRILEDAPEGFLDAFLRHAGGRAGSARMRPRYHRATLSRGFGCPRRSATFRSTGVADLTADAYRHVATVDCRCPLSPPVGSYATPRACRSMIALTPIVGASSLDSLRLIYR